MGTTNFDSIELSGSLTMTGGVLTAPSAATAPTSPSVGDQYYDTVLRKFRVYQDSGWSNIDGSAAGSLDAALAY